MLQPFPIFRGLSPDELARVEAIAHRRTVSKKTVIFHEGSEKEAVYLIEDGLVKTYKTDEEGHEQIVSLLQSGEMFPHTGFFNQLPYPATAETLVDTRLIVIPLGAFEQLIMSMPSIAIKIIDVLGGKIRELQQKLQELTGHDAFERFLSLLLQLADKQGTVQGKQIVLELPMTNQELANMIGTTRETANRILNQLKKDGILEVNRTEWIILDREALERRRG